MVVSVITPPAPLVTWAEAKAQLRLGTDNDSLQQYVEGLIAAASAWIDGPEGWLGRSVGQQTLELRQPSLCGSQIRLPYGPLISLTSIKYLDADGAEQTFSDANVTTLPASGLVLLNSSSAWPTVKSNDPEAVRIQYVAGSAPVPPAIKQAVLLLVAHWFKSRETVVTGTIVADLPFGVNELLSPYRRWSA